MQKAKGFILFVILNGLLWIGMVKLGIFDMPDLGTMREFLNDHDFTIEAIWENYLTGETNGNTINCPTEPIVLAELAEGQTGNVVWEYAGAWGLGKLLKRQAYATQRTLNILNYLFKNLTLLPYEDIIHCNLTLRTIKEDAEPLETLAERTKGQHLLHARFHMLPGAILPFVEEARVEFQFQDEVMKDVNQMMLTLGADKGRTVVGVHVRRKDYLNLLKGRYKLGAANASFYLDAMDWFRKNIGGNLVFGIVCDDLEWVRNNLIFSEDVQVVMHTPFRDLAFLCHADHTIIDYGTFGLWGALMSKGHTISLMRLDIDKQLAQYKNWHVFDERKYLSRLQI